MHQLLESWSVPWYIWLGLGAFITLLLTSAGFRRESDSFLARLLGMKPRKQPRIQPDEDEEDED
jgi:hypothetical protein